MGRNIETGKHFETTRFCANPDCEQEYVIQHGGQKSGSSPAVHVERVGEEPKGYCSTRCVFEANEWNYYGKVDADGNYIPGYRDEYISFTGLDPDEIRPKGYLAPSRIIKDSEGGDS